jgi:hypothetical protein
MKNACQYNISIQIKLDDKGAHCERSEGYIENTIKNEQILEADNPYGNGEHVVSGEGFEEGTTPNDRTNFSSNETIEEKGKDKLLEGY